MRSWRRWRQYWRRSEPPLDVEDPFLYHANMESQDWKSPRLCDCGCGEEFLPRRPWAKFLDADHRERYWSDLKRRALVLVRQAGET